MGNCILNQNWACFVHKIINTFLKSKHHEANCKNSQNCGTKIRGVRGHRQKTRKNSVKLGKNDKNRLKIKEKAEILAREIFKNEKSAEKRNSHTPVKCSWPSSFEFFDQNNTLHDIVINNSRATWPTSTKKFILSFLSF